MAVRKVDNRFFPVKKNGSLWKTGFSSKAKAEAAIRQNKSRLSKLTGGKSKSGGARKRASSPSPSNPPTTKHNKNTHHRFMKLLALGGAAGNRTMKFAETGNTREFSRGIPLDYTGLDTDNGSFDLGRTAPGYGGSLYLKIEDFILKGAGVAPPSLKRKGINAKVGLGVYHASAVANASGGSTPRDKFLRFYHSHFGVKLDSTGTDALDYSKPITEKVVPYIVVTKAMQFFKVN